MSCPPDITRFTAVRSPGNRLFGDETEAIDPNRPHSHHLVICRLVICRLIFRDIRVLRHGHDCRMRADALGCCSGDAGNKCRIVNVNNKPVE
jgi:hypothetical protein